jgi:hypothetical protein
VGAPSEGFLTGEHLLGRVCSEVQYGRINGNITLSNSRKVLTSCASATTGLVGGLFSPSDMIAAAAAVVKRLRCEAGQNSLFSRLMRGSFVLGVERAKPTMFPGSQVCKVPSGMKYMG